MSWFGGFFGRREEDPRNAIVKIRENILVLEKREEFLQKKIDEELKKAKANATSNPRAAKQALRQKKQYEVSIEKLAGSRMNLEQQVAAIEDANLNKETLSAMKQGANALKGIHRTMDVDQVEDTMDEVRNQVETSQEVSNALGNTDGIGMSLDDDELNEELAQLEQEELNNRLQGADAVPLHSPPVAAPVASPAVATAEDDEEEELRQLQASMAM